MSVLARLFKIGQAEANSVVDNLEDPIRMTEQGIRDLKRDLQAAIQSLGEIRALVISLDRQKSEAQGEAQSAEKKAMALLAGAEKGDIDKAQAEQLAMKMLDKKKTADASVARYTADYSTQKAMAEKLQAQVDGLEQQIKTFENELVTLKARSKTADSMKKINKQLAGVDPSGTLAMLERMKQKVNEDEATAQAYGEIAGRPSSTDEVDKLLASSSTSAPSEDLLALKKKMGLIQ
ncbi:MAG TPA: phage shock protein A [Syntrophobacteraceae bacterium]|nr:phage shock protein A [Syntrophobacteraceae bacterium]